MLDRASWLAHFTAGISQGGERGAFLSKIADLACDGEIVLVILDRLSRLAQRDCTRVRTGEDHQVRIDARIHSSLELRHHLVCRDRILALEMAAAFRIRLVFEHDGVGAGALEQLDCTVRVDRIAETGVGIGEDRYVDRVRAPPRRGSQAPSPRRARCPVRRDRCSPPVAPLTIIILYPGASITRAASALAAPGMRRPGPATSSRRILLLRDSLIRSSHWLS
jgi:hypothetical protein